MSWGTLLFLKSYHSNQYRTAYWLFKTFQKCRFLSKNPKLKIFIEISMLVEYSIHPQNFFLSSKYTFEHFYFLNHVNSTKIEKNIDPSYPWVFFLVTPWWPPRGSPMGLPTGPPRGHQWNFFGVTNEEKGVTNHFEHPKWVKIQSHGSMSGIVIRIIVWVYSNPLLM